MPTQNNVRLYKDIVRLTRVVAYDDIDKVVDLVRKLINAPEGPAPAPVAADPVSRQETSGLDRQHRKGATRSAGESESSE